MSNRNKKRRSKRQKENVKKVTGNKAAGKRSAKKKKTVEKRPLGFPEIPMCQECGEDEAIRFGEFADKNGGGFMYRFVCGKCAGKATGHTILIREYFEVPSTQVAIDGHMAEKDRVWESFGRMIVEFRSACGLMNTPPFTD